MVGTERTAQLERSAKLTHLEDYPRRRRAVSKNGKPHVVAMTKKVLESVKQALFGKSPDDYVPTRQGNKPVGDFRKAWWKIAAKASLGKWPCQGCGKTTADNSCSCGGKLCRAGVPESVFMEMAG